MRLIRGLFFVSMSMISSLSADVKTDLQNLDKEIQALEERDIVLKTRLKRTQSEAKRSLMEDWTNYQGHSRDATQVERELKLVEIEIENLKKERAELQKSIQ